MAASPIGEGLIARVTTALRYAMFGQAPLGWFGPLDPLPQQAPENVKGRAYDYPVGVNINFIPRSGEPTSFSDLKRLATHPIVAMLIQRQKDKIAAIDWQIKPKPKPGKSDDGGLDDPMIATLTAFFSSPDKEHDWIQWIGAVLDQLLVLDATTIYAAPTRAGGLYAAQVLDGATIKPLLDYGGRRPLAGPAYQQVMKGLPAVDYTNDELIYFPQTYRADRVYGYSRLEQAKDLVETAISRLRNQKGFFDFGNVGDGYFTAPESWTPDQVNALESKWNSMMLGDPATRRMAPFLPNGVTWNATKTEILSDTFDEYLIRLLCFPFGVAPQPFMKQTGMGHGSANTEHEAAEEGGLEPLMQFVERLCSRIIGKWFGRADLEFTFIDDREFDPEAAAKIDDLRIRNGTLLRNEVRDRNGEPPLPDGDKAMLEGTGWKAAEDVTSPPEPTETPAPAAPAAAGGEPDQGAAGGAASGTGEAMAKSADAAAAHRLGILLAAYLKAKAEPVANAIVEALPAVAKAADMDGFEKQIEDAIAAADWDWSDLSGAIQPVLAGVAAAAGQDAVSALGLFDAAVLQQVTASATAYAEERGAEMVGMKLVDGELVDNPNAAWSIPQATRDMLRNLIRDAMAEGQTSQQLKASIMESAAFSKDRSMTIARTETAMADVQGSIAGWKASGLVAGKRFDAAPDCCDECQAQDGEIVDLDEDFSNGDPPVHPNCRCSCSAVLDDEMPG